WMVWLIKNRTLFDHRGDMARLIMKMDRSSTLKRHTLVVMQKGYNVDNEKKLIPKILAVEGFELAIDMKTRQCTFLLLDQDDAPPSFTKLVYLSHYYQITL
ncbi:hypothetical protein MKX03_030252, partial [Papaver bracteatum]